MVVFIRIEEVKKRKDLNSVESTHMGLKTERNDTFFHSLYREPVKNYLADFIH